MGLFQAGDLGVHLGVFLPHLPEPFLADEADAVSFFREADVRVVLPVEEAVFRPGGHHPVGFVGALGHQVVQQHADIALAAVDKEGFLALQLQGGVHAGDEALHRRLLIAGGAVELPRPVEAGHFFQLQGTPQFQGIHAVILNGVGRTHHLRMLQADHRMEHLKLHVLRHAGGEALDVHFLRVQAHGLQEQLVPGLVGKTHHLVLDAGAIAGPHALDDPGEKRGAVEVIADDLVGRFRRIGEPADRPVFQGLCAGEGKGLRVWVPVLGLQPGIIHGEAVDAGGRAGLEAA